MRRCAFWVVGLLVVAGCGGGGGNGDAVPSGPTRGQMSANAGVVCTPDPLPEIGMLVFNVRDKNYDGYQLKVKTEADSSKWYKVPNPHTVKYHKENNSVYVGFTYAVGPGSLTGTAFPVVLTDSTGTEIPVDNVAKTAPATWTWVDNCPK